MSVIQFPRHTIPILFLPYNDVHGSDLAHPCSEKLNIYTV